MKRLLSIILILAALLCACARTEEIPDPEVYVSDAVSDELYYTVAFRKEDRTLAEEFDRVLGEVIADGSVGMICDNYLGQDLSEGLSESGWFQGAGDDGKLEEVEESGKIIIGFQESCYPMAWTDANGNVVGIDAAIAFELGRRMGLQVIFEPIEWKAKEAALESQKVHAIFSGFAYSEERAEQFNLTRPYLKTELVLISPEKAPIDRFDQLRDLGIGVRSNSIGEALVSDTDVKYARVMASASCAYSYYRMKEGKLEAVIAEKTFVDYLLAGNLEK